MSVFSCDIEHFSLLQAEVQVCINMLAEQLEGLTKALQVAIQEMEEAQVRYNVAMDEWNVAMRTWEDEMDAWSAAMYEWQNNGRQGTPPQRPTQPEQPSDSECRAAEKAYLQTLEEINRVQSDIEALKVQQQVYQCMIESIKQAEEGSYAIMVQTTIQDF